MRRSRYVPTECGQAVADTAGKIFLLQNEFEGKEPSQ